MAQARAAHPTALIWAEAEALDGAVDRLGLRASETLIVVTVPPSAEIWSAALAAVNPHRLILFGNRPATETMSGFMTRLAALVKYAVNRKGGAVGLEAFAAAMSQGEGAVQVGLQALRALGKLDYQASAAGEYQLKLAEASPSDQVESLRKRLSLLLREARAYRNYWLTMKIQD